MRKRHTQKNIAKPPEKGKKRSKILHPPTTHCDIVIRLKVRESHRTQQKERRMRLWRRFYNTITSSFMLPFSEKSNVTTTERKGRTIGATQTVCPIALPRSFSLRPVILSALSILYYAPIYTIQHVARLC